MQEKSYLYQLITGMQGEDDDVYFTSKSYKQLETFLHDALKDNPYKVFNILEFLQDKHQDQFNKFMKYKYKAPVHEN